MNRIWDILQIEETTDKREIKRAYARLSKEIHPEEKPEEFQTLYEAYQGALRYASYRKDAEEADVPETEQKEKKVPVSEEQNDYEKFGFYSEEMQGERLRLEEIRYFQSCWNKQIFEWKRGREFLSEEWKAYLQSERFREIMRFPLVMETIATGMMKHFHWKREVLLFFWELYGPGILEKLEEESSEEDRPLQLLYKSLYPVGKEMIQKQNIEAFVENWRLQMDLWEKGGKFLSGKFLSEEWIEYLRSEKFREIMWHSIVLETITAGMMQDFQYRERIALFFWNLYGFGELGEENCTGKSLLLYKTLYPAYMNHVNRIMKRNVEIQKEEHENEKKAINNFLYFIFGVLWVGVIAQGTLNEGFDIFEIIFSAVFLGVFFGAFLLFAKLLLKWSGVLK